MTVSEKNPIPVDKIAHDLSPCFPYGHFKVASVLKDKDDVQFGGLTVFVDIKKVKDPMKEIPTIGAIGP